LGATLITEGFAVAKIDIPLVASKLYALLEPIEPSMRKRAIKATLTLLGDDDGVDLEPENRSGRRTTETESDAGGSSLPPKVKAWMRSNSVDENQLQHTFHFDNGKAELIAGNLPGKTNKDRTINAYLLTGLTKFLETGEAKFDDTAARAACKSFGCLDEGNHAHNLKGKGNLIGGTKSAGWLLTAPGIKAGAELVKAMADTK
jgi:hypothetical protein